MRKDNLIMSLWMLLILLMMLSTCCDELKEDYKPKQIVNYNTVKEIQKKRKSQRQKINQKLNCRHLIEWMSTET